VRKTTKARNPKSRKMTSQLIHNDVFNRQMVLKNGYQPLAQRGKAAVKYFDTSNSATVLSSGLIIDVTLIPQGIAVTNRIGDTCFLNKFLLNYSVSAENSDINSSFRLIVFQWHPNLNLLAPVVTDVLQTISINSFYDWQYSNQFTILYDAVHWMAGLATAPTASGNQGYFGEIDIRKARKRVEFAPGSSNGSELLYILVISDSTIAPGPNLLIYTRTLFTDE
jgi:hypothetical protein